MKNKGFDIQNRITTVIAHCPWGLFTHRVGGGGVGGLCVLCVCLHSENIITFLLNNTYSLSTGPTVLISYTVGTESIQTP